MEVGWRDGRGRMANSCSLLHLVVAVVSATVTAGGVGANVLHLSPQNKEHLQRKLPTFLIGLLHWV